LDEIKDTKFRVIAHRLRLVGLFIFTEKEVSVKELLVEQKTTHGKKT